MKKLLYILILLTLPFREGLGVGYSAYASPYEVQVPMSCRQHSSSPVVYTASSARLHSVGSSGTYRPSQTVVNMGSTVRLLNSSSVPTGRFSTYVPSVNASGRAVLTESEGVGRPHVRRVSHDDDEDDPFMGKVDPVGDIPWWLFVLLAVGYGAYRRRFSKQDVG